MVVNTGRNGDYSHPNFASAKDLDSIRVEPTEAGVEHEVLQPTDGRPSAEAILGAAITNNADLVVIGLRRRSPVGKLITGSTAQHVLLDAQCPDKLEHTRVAASRCADAWGRHVPSMAKPRRSP